MIRSVIPAATGASAPAVAALPARPDVSAPLIDLSVGGPDFDDLVRDLTVSGSALPQRACGHGYGPLGWPELRELVAQLLSRHGAPTSPDEVLITNGAQEAISLAIGLVASDGRRIAIESPGYPSALDAIVRAGGQPLAVERDAGGLRVDSLKQLLERHHVHDVRHQGGSVGWTRELSTSIGLADPRCQTSDFSHERLSHGPVEQARNVD